MAGNSGAPLLDQERYARNLLLAGVGEEGQKRLLASSVLVVGAGGLGSSALFYLAAAGVGRLTVAESDRVELSNLNRQVLYDTRDLGRSKAESARKRILALNPDCRVRTLPERLAAENVKAALSGQDLALDCTDNFATRFLLADACWREGVPLVSAAAVGFQGQVFMQVRAPGNPCLRCLIPKPPPPGAVPRSEEAGILGSVAGMLGALQATEAMKWLLGLGEPLTRRFLAYDGLAARFSTIERAPNPNCPLCG
ncbi:MAG: HesA/MoeB/ThiF family protein [Planctomycetota bacterium]